LIVDVLGNKTTIAILNKLPKYNNMSKILLTWSKLIPLLSTEIEKVGDVGGVYRLSKKSEDGRYYVFFVGSGENIKEKLLQHISKNEPNLRLKNFLQLGGDIVFRYAVVQDRNIQQAIEKQIYKTYLPEYNTEEPKSSLEVEANLN
jgi:excinuclease UvrABC nuclease subunit